MCFFGLHLPYFMRFKTGREKCMISHSLEDFFPCRFPSPWWFSFFHTIREKLQMRIDIFVKLVHIDWITSTSEDSIETGLGVSGAVKLFTLFSLKTFLSTAFVTMISVHLSPLMVLLLLICSSKQSNDEKWT